MTTGILTTRDEGTDANSLTLVMELPILNKAFGTMLSLNLREIPC